ncbi:MAG: NHL domain-containing thioredoxin family protein [Nocardioides sp.]|nr:NHL domain-containing thioredoxin family protein [Nocardioides sp.]
MSTRPRVRAPELVGRGWLGTGGETLGLADFRGRFLLLDFWTFCCVNCLHVLDELRPLEDRWADELVVVGVHSPKFVHEADPAALAAAVERYEVTHPVLDDPDLQTWQAYTARAWPTLVLVDPEGYVVAQYAGEGHVHAIDALLADLVPRHHARGTLDTSDARWPTPITEAPHGALRFPAKAVALPGGTFLVADAGRHRLTELAADAETVVRRIGGPARGLADGGPDDTRFSEPNGLCLLPDDVAAEVGYDVVVADTVNHALRGVRLADGSVSTLAGDGTQWMPGDDSTHLSSPWDVAWWRDRVWVAMAGVHQLWAFDPRTGTVEAAAGTTNEGLVDGPADQAWFAQTSGLAADGDRLWLADSEVSALRWLDAEGTVGTAVGRGLFDFGFRDGPAAEALLQHPLGVTVLPDGSVAICDTYNGAVRRYDPATGEVSTLARDLAEPSGAVVARDLLLVVESTGHRLTGVPLGAAGTAVDGFAHTTQRPVTELAPGSVVLEVAFTPPPGQKVDDRFGPATQLVVSATPPALLRAGEGRDTALVRTLELDPAVGDGVLHVAARAASCDADPAVEGAACHVHQQDWGIPVRLVPGAPTRLDLPLGG